jgi:hypothetical protein
MWCVRKRRAVTAGSAASQPGPLWNGFAPACGAVCPAGYLWECVCVVCVRVYYTHTHTYTQVPAHHDKREVLEALVNGGGRTRRPFRPQRQVNVLELGKRCGSVERLRERGREQLRLGKAVHDGPAAVAHLLPALQPRQQRAQLGLVHGPRHFLPVARNKRHRTAVGSQLQRTLDLPLGEAESGRLEARRFWVLIQILKSQCPSILTR